MSKTGVLDVFLNPRSVALIGVSRKTGKGALNILENLIDYGFKGKVYIVHPVADEILGIKTFRTIEDLPDGIDLGVIAISREHVPAAILACAKKGIEGLIIVTQGFAESDARGKELQAEIDSLINETGIRVIGPNTMGTINSFSSFSAFFMPCPKQKGAPTAFVTQTGSFVLPLCRQLPLGKGIDLGNACDIGFSEVLEYLKDDPEVKIVSLYMDGIKNGKKFVDVAKQVVKKKPILAIKSGRSAKGAERAASHTGSLAGQDEVYSAAFQQAGVIRINDLDEHEDYTKAFLRLPPLKGNRIGVITTSGAVGILMTDNLESHGLQLAEISRETKESVQRLFPEWMFIDNPIDLWIASMSYGYKEVVARALSAMLADSNVDGIAMYSMSIFPPEEDEVFDIAPLLQRIVPADVDKPLAIAMVGAYADSLCNEIERTNPKVATFPSISRATRALGFLNRYREICNRLP